MPINATNTATPDASQTCQLAPGQLPETLDGYSGKACPQSWATENTQEVEQLRRTERRIAADSGWNTSTRVIWQVLRRLRGERGGS